MALLQALGLPASAVRSFVLDNDPVPRAMLSADPAFALLKQSAPVAWLLQARGLVYPAVACLSWGHVLLRVACADTAP